jgi:hypothetical protein
VAIAAATRAEPEQELIAGRYQIEASIAHGGMGVVYRAHDRVLGRAVALKRLLLEGDARRRTRMFEREFHTLAGLKHPRIIEVYDYGLDERGAYYTMELLDGRDLRELAPLSYRTACLYLRDVASSLALLHARSLLHRDLSPRNVRITSDGRAKLIDFGALSGFGRNPTVVGTAPLVPPEALYGAELDQRADLYALGALAYWLLSGRHTFDVRTLGELPAAWGRLLAPPSEHAPASQGLAPIPAALDALVLSLLSQNPLARPSSAAEVSARLSAVAELPAESEPLSALSYLVGGKTVGRGRERAQLRKRLKTALAGRGSVVALEAEAGMGCGRILNDLAVEARLQGATAVVVDANQHRNTYAVVEEIARSLFAAQPQRAATAMGEHAGTLARFTPGSHGRASAPRFTVGDGDRQGGDPREQRLRVQTALLEWLERLAAEVPLLIAVHNFQRADETSAALLAALAQGIAERGMLVALAYDAAERVSAPAALASLQQSAWRVQLHGLSQIEVRALVEATFGPVPGSERLADYLHELTGGNPQGCRDLMQHLVENGIISFADGVWALPQELTDQQLPADLGQALDARIARLGSSARRLVSMIAVHRGPVLLERLEAIALRERIDDPLAALSEAEQRGVLVVDDESIRFSHVSVRDAALRLLSADEQRRLHAQFGALLLQQGAQDVTTQLDAGWHLLHGGEQARGADLLAEVGVALSLDADSMPAAIPALRAALDAFRALGRSQREQARLLAPLAIAGFYADRKIIEAYGDDAVAALQHVLGLGLARRLRPWLGLRLSMAIGFVGVGLGGAVLRHGPRRGRLIFTESVTLFITLVSMLVGVGTLTLDAPRARRYAELLEPLTVLGKDHVAAFSYRNARAFALLPEDRIAQTRASCRDLIARLDDGRPVRRLPERTRRMLRVPLVYALGVMETFRESPEALRLADELEQAGSRLPELFAHQIRANYHGLRGEVEQAEHSRQRVQQLAGQAGSGWHAEVWAPSSEILCCMLTGDLIGLKRVGAQLERLAAEIPSLGLHVQLAAGGYHHLRGEHAQAHAIGHAVIASSEPRGFIGWTPAIASDVATLALLGRPEEAKALGLRTLALFDAEDRKVTTMVVPLVIELAIAEATLGDFAGAATRIAELQAELGEAGGPVTRGALFETAARVALLAKDLPAARAHLAQMQRCFKPTENPALLARCERLRRALAADVPEDSNRDTLDLGLPTPSDVVAVVRRCEGHQQRCDRVLDLLLEHTGGASGYLFGCEDGELMPVSPKGDQPAPSVCARAYEELQLTDQDVTVATGDRADATLVLPTADAQDRHRTFVLSVHHGDATKVLAVAAIALGGRPLRTPLPSFLAALAEALSDPQSASTQASRSSSSHSRRPSLVRGRQQPPR